MAFVKCLVLLLSVAASTSALATPHAARHSVHHRAIAARVADPAPLDVLPVPIRKRADTRRCKQRASSSVLQVSSSIPPVVHAVNTPVPAAQPTTTPPPQPATTTYKQATPTTTTKVAAPASGNQPSFMYGTQTGQGTFYASTFNLHFFLLHHSFNNPPFSAGLGSCGITNKDTDYIAAVSHLLYDTYPYVFVFRPSAFRSAHKVIQRLLRCKPQQQPRLWKVNYCELYVYSPHNLPQPPGG